MAQQMIISISREYGSSGHEIAEMLANKLDMPLYDRNIFQEIAKEKGILTEDMEKYDEKPKNPLFVRKLGEHTNSMEEHIANMQFDYLKEKAEAGESFIVVGRCAEAVLSQYRGLVTVFITADENEKLTHIMTKFGVGELEAREKMFRHDKKRKQYHANYSNMTWGDIHSYDLCINSTSLGLEKCVDIIADFAAAKLSK